ncbi:hypothetical protein [Rhodococcus aetherivorans]|uniref:hypothetical protein n=1 Tax=Rhodococcus aetherivorans TaxID=191292 RepID=UPI0012DEA8D4|nr:hypothetical protein [Rhodococcus aetherivorans]
MCEIRSVHKSEFPEASWDWGWIAVEDGVAVAVLTTTATPVDESDNPIPPVRWAKVQIVYSTVKGCGYSLLQHGKTELNSIDWPLFRSGRSTEGGEAVCEKAHVTLHDRTIAEQKRYIRKKEANDRADSRGTPRLYTLPEHAPISRMCVSKAIEIGKKDLEQAASFRNLNVPDSD